MYFRLNFTVSLCLSDYVSVQTSHLPIQAIAARVLAFRLPRKEPVTLIVAHWIRSVCHPTGDFFHLVIRHLNVWCLSINPTSCIVDKKSDWITGSLLCLAFEHSTNLTERIAGWQLCHLKSGLIARYQICMKAKEPTQGKNEGARDHHDDRVVSVSLELVEPNLRAVVSHNNGCDRAPN